MPKVNVYLPDRLATAVQNLEIPLSAVCQAALEREVERGLLSLVPVERFTPRLQHLLAEAASLADGRGHNYVGVEHVQLAILDEGKSIPAHAIEALQMTEPLRASVYDMMTSGSPSNRVVGRDGRIIAWLIGADEGAEGDEPAVRYARPDVGAVTVERDAGGDPVALDSKGRALPSIDPADAPLILGLDKRGRPVVIVDAKGKHTGKSP